MIYFVIFTVYVLGQAPDVNAAPGASMHTTTSTSGPLDPMHTTASTPGPLDPMHITDATSAPLDPMHTTSTHSCTQYDEPNCGSNEVQCAGFVDPATGCQMMGHCMPYNASNTCNPSCPVYCGMNEHYCPGNGCNIPPSCVPQNETCPHHCPHVHQPECGQNQIFCSGMEDAHGCAMAGHCIDHNATDTCPSSCPVHCDSDEKFCTGNGCDKPDSCVPMDEPCPIHCTPFTEPTCGANETLCAGPVDANGCPSMGSCLYNNPEQKCGAQCPVHCDADEKHCAGNGGDIGGSCIAMNETCPTHCPCVEQPTCTDNQIFCSGMTMPDGCEMMGYCLPQNADDKCPSMCAVYCGSGEKHCSGNGCNIPDSCVAEAEECPFHCQYVEQPTCGENEMFCPGSVDANGCASAGTCQYHNPNDTCSSTCPVHCGEGEQHCSGNGCDVPDSCVAQGETCPHACPHMPSYTCGENEIECKMGVDMHGCDMGSWCMYQDPNPPPGSCQMTCPVYCAHDQKHCPGDGCNVPDSCVAQDEPCPQVCPHMQSNTCGENEIECKYAVDSNGCDMGGYCMWQDPNLPAGSCQMTCPVYCAHDQKHCPGNGCDVPDSCVAQDEPCPHVCPHVSSYTCSENEIECKYGVDSNGCDMGGYCMWQDPNPTAGSCPMTCPTYCAHDQQYCMGGMDANNCMLPSTCIGMNETCPETPRRLDYEL